MKIQKLTLECTSEACGVFIFWGLRSTDMAVLPSPKCPTP